MEQYSPYPCERCGDCCRHVDLIEAMKTFNRGDGVCKHLREDNLCEIYSTRPPLCNSEWLYKNFYSAIAVKDFHQMMQGLCKEVRRLELERFHKKVSDT